MITFNSSLVFITRISAHEKKILQSSKRKNQEYGVVCITPHQCFEGDGCINAGCLRYDPCEGLRINEPHVAPIFIPQTLFPTERKLPSIHL